MKSYSVRKLNRLSKRHEIWCFGCGKRLNDMLALYGEEPFLSKISALLDNNSSLWGNRKQVGGRLIPIESPELIGTQGGKGVIVLITSDRYREIYASISERWPDIKMTYIRYPVHYSACSRILMRACSILPLRRQILFNAGEEPHENSVAIAECLTHRYEGEKYKLVFMADDEENRNRNLPGAVFLDRKTLRRRNCLRVRLRYCFYVATAKYIFYENTPLEKARQNQILIYLNHGAVPLKDVRDVLMQPKEIDYAICPSEGCADIYVQQYGIPKEKQLYIMPPRDYFLTQGISEIDRIIKTENRQIILWLPTFRSLKGTDRKDSTAEGGLPLLTGERDFRKINASLRRNRQLLLIKKHPREKERLEIPAFCDCIKLLQEEVLEKAGVILHEVLGGTAALITDYSGISFEYLLLDRPVGYAIGDMESYVRGFAFENPLDYMPGPKIYTVEELLGFLDDVRAGRDGFQKDRAKIAREFFRGNEARDGAQELMNWLEERG